MAMFPKNHKFTSTEAASAFTCTQMMEGAPWSYELDIFCLAGLNHTLVFGKYMTNLVKDATSGSYRVRDAPPPGFDQALWVDFFNRALNDKYSAGTLPSVRDYFVDYLFEKYDNEDIIEAFSQLVSLVEQ